MPVVLKDNKIQETPDSKSIDVEFLSADRFTGLTTNLIPNRENVQSTRLPYGSRFAGQSLSLVNREAPLVQSGMNENDSMSWEEHAGRIAGAERVSDEDEGSEVLEVGNDFIKLRGITGEEKTISLWHNAPYNRKSYLNQTPKVKVGDILKKDQILATSNFTDDNGSLALGLNARVAMVADRGRSMDDAIVISESFAKRLTSEHMEDFAMDKDSSTKFGLDHFRSLFPDKYSKDQLANLDENGVVKPGTILKKGDPVILATRPRTISSSSQELGKLGKAISMTRNDASTVWDHDQPGEVTDVSNGKKGISVFAKYNAPAAKGDKMVFRPGGKCYSSDTEVFTDKGWILMKDLTEEDQVAALFDKNLLTTAPDEQQANGSIQRQDSVKQNLVARFVKPLHYTSYFYKGVMYGLETEMLSYLVTPNHRVWSMAHAHGNRFTAMDATEIHLRARRFMKEASFELEETRIPKFFELPAVDFKKCGDRRTEFPFRPFIKFLAFYLAEGNIRKEPDNRVVITQAERSFCRNLEALFDELGLNWEKTRGDTQYTLQSNKALAEYLRQFGRASEKYIPDFIFNLPQNYLQDFVDWIWQGDGDKDKGIEYYSTSKRLVEGLERIFILLGRTSTIKVREPRAHLRKADGVFGKEDRIITGKHPQYTLRVLEQGVQYGTRKNYKTAYYTQQYSGNVYCVQVPGCGVVLTRRNGKVMWNGNSIISAILPDDQILQDENGEPFEVLLNPLSLPSRVNAATLYELWQGKVAKKNNEAIKTRYTPAGKSTREMVAELLEKHGLKDTERVYDPVVNKFLEQPVSTGYGYVQKLTHTASSKSSSRGLGSYDLNEQPQKGGGDAAQSKRISGLATTALMAAGAYNVLREGSTIRGQKNHEFWRLLRNGYNPPTPGPSFVFDKFKHLLSGAGYRAKDMGGGILRLGFMTDKDLESRSPVEVKNGRIVHPETLEPYEDGLFGKPLVAGERWGYMPLPEPLPNPAAAGVIKTLLGLKDSEFRDIIAGRRTVDGQMIKSASTREEAIDVGAWLTGHIEDNHALEKVAMAGARHMR